VTGARVLVAGIGNVLFGDDGFGVEVAKQVAARGVPPHVRVADYGTRGLHLALDLTAQPYDVSVFVDAAPRGGSPGSLYLIEPDPEVAPVDAGNGHGMTVDGVLSMIQHLGGFRGRVLIVGCEPASTDEGIGLSAPVTNAIDGAVRMVFDCIEGRDKCA